MNDLNLASIDEESEYETDKEETETKPKKNQVANSDDENADF